MIIARILGTVVATQKDERLSGKKLLIVRPINVDGSDTTGYVVAVDTVGAGDAFLAVAGPVASLGVPLEHAGFLGNAAGGIKVGIIGHRRSIDKVEVVKFVTTLLK